MTDQTKAPERIWAAECRQTQSTMWWPDDAGGVGVEYTRADLSDAKDKRIAELKNQLDSARHSVSVLERRNLEIWDAVDAKGKLIEELEAKLAKAVDALKKASGALGDICDGEPEWPDNQDKEIKWCRNRAGKAWTIARTTLAALKGGG